MAVLFRWSQAARSLLVALSGADTALSSSVDFVANDAITRGALSTAFSVSSLQSWADGEDSWLQRSGALADRSATPGIPAEVTAGAKSSATATAVWSRHASGGIRPSTCRLSNLQVDNFGDLVDTSLDGSLQQGAAREDNEEAGDEDDHYGGEPLAMEVHANSQNQLGEAAWGRDAEVFFADYCPQPVRQTPKLGSAAVAAAPGAHARLRALRAVHGLAIQQAVP
eukprot:s2719_g10.t1